MITTTELMKMEKNPETNNWLCWISGTGYAYYYKRKKDALDFVSKVNDAYAKGEIYLDSEGILRKRK
jgi:hypothetical protein